jgi:undecaprenyl-diphosphatase
MNIFAQAMLFSMFYPKLRIYLFLFAGLVAISRVYVGVHYPLDILFGAIIGIAIGSGVYHLYKTILRKLTIKKNKLKNLTSNNTINIMEQG